MSCDGRMAPGAIIRATNLGKRYRIGARRPEYSTLRDAISTRFSFRHRARQRSDVVWALRGASFEIEQGQVVGVIGANGAGKSTLLKLLSRITRPTEGRAELRGRVGSLLEVGTGFHPELTGRENIFLNGAILGMRRSEIEHRFDEIVDFSEVGRFLDTPVKHYSSGMFVRLAFSVAAHLETEILLVDEVLAVGDAEFRRRSLGRMRDVAHGGRTVVFVSHNLAAIENFCDRGILLDSGRVLHDGPTEATLAEYLKMQESRLLQGLDESVRRSGTGAVRFTTLHLETVAGEETAFARSGQDVVLVFGYRRGVPRPLTHVDVGFSIHGPLGDRLAVLYSSYTGRHFRVDDDVGQFRCHLSRLPLVSGRYRIAGRITVAGEEADWPDDGIGFLDVEPGDFFGSGHAGFGGGAPVLLDAAWS